MGTKEPGNEPGAGGAHHFREPGASAPGLGESAGQCHQVLPRGTVRGNFRCRGGIQRCRIHHEYRLLYPPGAAERHLSEILPGGSLPQYRRQRHRSCRGQAGGGAPRRQHPGRKQPLLYKIHGNLAKEITNTAQ